MSNKVPPTTLIKPSASFKTLGKRDAKILVITEPVQLGEKNVIPKNYAAYFKKVIDKMGMDIKDFAFLSPSPPVPPDIKKSKSKQETFVKNHREAFAKAIQQFDPKIVIGLGKEACSAIAGKNITLKAYDARITKHKTIDKPVVCSYGIGYCLVYKKSYPLETSLQVVKDYFEGTTNQHEFTAEWRDDISDIVDILEKRVKEKGQAFIAYDTETTGLEWHRDSIKPITLQLAYAPDKAVISCVHPRYKRTKDIPKLITQWKRILENPKIKKAAHNLKFDHHITRKLGIRVEGWLYDTQQLAWFADEEMPQKNLASCTKRWVKEMAGYSDLFDEMTDKSQMMSVPYDQMCDYGCGDVIATYLLARKLVSILKQDPKHFNVYNKVKLPAILSLADMERNGVLIDTKFLLDFVPIVDKKINDMYKELIALIPKPCMRAFVRTENIDFSNPENFKLTPDNLTKILFTKDGYNLKPKMLTDTTNKPKTDASHLGLFKDNPFIQKYQEYKQIKDLKSKYVGQPATTDQDAKGFFKYISDDGRIHTSFHILTTTGRTGSSNPNLQNITKKSDLAWEFRKCFIPKEGYTFVSADLSQIELRLIAWEANDPRMLQAYNNDEDLHALTASAIVGMDFKDFLKEDKKFIKQSRQDAKGVNFGFCFELHYKSYPEYARNNYGLHVTEEQALEFQNKYFRLYKKVPKWHEFKKQFAKKHGFVRSLHGLKRTLPQIHSSNYGESSAAGRDAINNTIQGLGSDMGLMALEAFLGFISPDIARPSLFIHDDVTVEVKTEHAMEVAGLLKWFMANPPLEKYFGIKSPIPFKAGISIGQNLGQMKELEDDEVPLINPKDSNLIKF